MLYAFMLGRVYTLSLAEVIRVLNTEGVSYNVKTVAPEIALIETEKEIDYKSLQSKLGGTIKIIQIIDTLNRKKTDYPSTMLPDYLDFKLLQEKYLANYSGKVQFGVSIYIMDPEIRLHFSEPKKVATLIKNFLKLHDISVRFVMPDPPSFNLPSVVVTKNQLLEKGAEFVILLGTQNLSIGKTLSVQDFEDYGRRDYQRPYRNLKMGMLPPKVAQIMVNLAELKRNSKILDPFCGGGTVLQEALLLGYHAVGSDKDEQAVEGAEKNLFWFRNRYKIAPGKYKTLQLDATSQLLEEFGENSFDAVITEGWLGPLYSDFPDKDEIKKNFKRLLEVYVKALEQYKKVVKPGGKIVMAFPAYRTGKDKYVFFPTLDFIEKLGYHIEDPIPAELIEKYDFLKVTERNSIVYDRKNQIVAREILIVSKQ